MAVNGKRKGNSFENDIAKIFSKFFDDTFKRVPQSGALTGGMNRNKVTGLREDAKEILSGDLITPAWFKFSIECKSYADDPKFHQILEGKAPKLDEWIKQADGDAAFSHKESLVIFKISRKGIFACFDSNLPDIAYTGEPHMMYKGKTVMTLDKFLLALGASYKQEVTSV